MKKMLVLLALALMAGCTSPRTFDKMETTYRNLTDPSIGQVEATLESYMVSDLDEVYHVTYFPADQATFDRIMGTAVAVSYEDVSGVNVTYNYLEAGDTEPYALNAFLGGHFYQFSTDAPVGRKDVMKDLFKYYFNLK